MNEERDARKKILIKRFDDVQFELHMIRREEFRERDELLLGKFFTYNVYEYDSFIYAVYYSVVEINQYGGSLMGRWFEVYSKGDVKFSNPHRLDYIDKLVSDRDDEKYTEELTKKEYMKKRKSFTKWL